MHNSYKISRSAFTLVELLIGMGVSAVMLAGLLTSTLSLQRSYKASEYYSAATADQVRALDYIVRDTRGATTAVASATGDSLTLTLPAFYTAYDAQGNPATGAVPREPVFSTTTAATYGTAAEQLTIVYSVSSGKLIRQVKVGTAAATESIIASDVDNFDFDFAALDSTITASLSFSPRFRGIANVTDLKTKRSAAIYMRNHK